MHRVRVQITIRMIAVVAATSTLLLHAAPSESYDYPLTPGVRELFLDDLILGAVYNLERRVHAVEKYGAGPVSRQAVGEVFGTQAAPGRLRVLGGRFKGRIRRNPAPEMGRESAILQPGCNQRRASGRGCSLCEERSVEGMGREEITAFKRRPA